MNKYYSAIYWHFLGSPNGIDWTNITSPKDILAFGAPKTDDECMDILEKIIVSKKLLSKSREKINGQVSTEPFCCVTDIPVQNLSEHSKYYGNVAIGFNHKSIHKYFNPVLYITKEYFNEEIVRDSPSPKLVELLTGGAMVGAGVGAMLASPILGAFFSKYLKDKMEAKINEGDQTKDVEQMKEAIRFVNSKVLNFIKLTDFSEIPEDSFYREREWRKNGDFNFSDDDVETIIVPNEKLKAALALLKMCKNENATVLTWELLDKI